MADIARDEECGKEWLILQGMRNKHNKTQKSTRKHIFFNEQSI